MVTEFQRLRVGFEDSSEARACLDLNHIDNIGELIVELQEKKVTLARALNGETERYHRSRMQLENGLRKLYTDIGLARLDIHRYMHVVVGRI